MLALARPGKTVETEQGGKKKEKKRKKNIDKAIRSAWSYVTNNFGMIVRLPYL